MPIQIVLVYLVLAAVSVGLALAGPFHGIGLLRAAPTLLLAVAAWRYTRPRFGYTIAWAVALGAAGDFFLASQSRAGFLPGLVAFLLGHCCYLWAFSRDLRPTRRRAAVLLVALASLFVLSLVVVLRLVHAQEQALIAPVVVYIAVLGATMAVCLFHESATPWIAAGGVTFVVSDAHIAVNHMLLDSPLLPITLSGYTTYYLAQFLLVYGAMRETSAKAITSPGSAEHAVPRTP